VWENDALRDEPAVGALTHRRRFRDLRARGGDYYMGRLKAIGDELSHVRVNPTRDTPPRRQRVLSPICPVLRKAIGGSARISKGSLIPSSMSPPPLLIRRELLER
jgi:hypothetical protein